MNNENFEKLKAACPHILRKSVPDDISCQDGWFELLLETCQKLDLLVVALATTDSEPLPFLWYAKQKMGMLRMHLFGDPTSEMKHLVFEAEKKSREICEQCGKPGKVLGRFAIYTACNDHAKPEDKVLHWQISHRLSKLIQRIEFIPPTDDLDRTLRDNELEALKKTWLFLKERRFFDQIPGSRYLNSNEIVFCLKRQYDIGFDTDNPRETEVQYSHICYPYDEDKGTLCGSPHLWFHGGDVRSCDLISCVKCLEILNEQMQE